MANALVDELNKPDQLDTAAIQEHELTSGCVLAAHVSVGVIDRTHLATDSVIARHIVAGNINADHLENNCIYAQHIRIREIGMQHLETNQMSSGSPAAGGNFAWTTTGSVSAGSKLTVTFGKSFLVAPTVIVGGMDGNAGWVQAGSITTTDCVVTAAVASSCFALVATGSGTI